MKDKTFNIYKKYILDIADKKYKPLRKRIFSLSYYLNAFIQVLKDVTKWKSLQLKSKYIFLWKSIYNEFNKWTKDDGAFVE